MIWRHVQILCDPRETLRTTAYLEQLPQPLLPPPLPPASIRDPHLLGTLNSFPKESSLHRQPFRSSCKLGPRISHTPSLSPSTQSRVTMRKREVVKAKRATGCVRLGYRSTRTRSKLCWAAIFVFQWHLRCHSDWSSIATRELSLVPKMIIVIPYHSTVYHIFWITNSAAMLVCLMG